MPIAWKLFRLYQPKQTTALVNSASNTDPIVGNTSWEVLKKILEVAIELALNSFPVTRSGYHRLAQSLLTIMIA